MVEQNDGIESDEMEDIKGLFAIIERRMNAFTKQLKEGAYSRGCYAEEARKMAARFERLAESIEDGSYI